MLGDPDGLSDLASVTIGQTTFTIEQLKDSSLEKVVFTDYGELKITSYAEGIAYYTYTLNRPSEDGDNNEQDVVTIAVVDAAGATAESQLTITIIDDKPVVTAQNTPTVIAQPNQPTTLTGVWSPTIGADSLTLPTIEDFLADVKLLSVQVTSGSVVQELPLTAFSLSPATSTSAPDNSVTYVGSVTYDPDLSGPALSRTLPISITLYKSAQGDYKYDVVIGGTANVSIVPV